MNNPHKTLPLWQVLLCGAAIVSLAMGIRHGFGLWLQPMTLEMGWGREDFATAIGIQNICWGLFGIFSGMLADRFDGVLVDDNRQPFAPGVPMMPMKVEGDLHIHQQPARRLGFAGRVEVGRGRVKLRGVHLNA